MKTWCGAREMTESELEEEIIELRLSLEESGRREDRLREEVSRFIEENGVLAEREADSKNSLIEERCIHEKAMTYGQRALDILREMWPELKSPLSQEVYSLLLDARNAEIASRPDPKPTYKKSRNGKPAKRKR